MPDVESNEQSNPPLLHDKDVFSDHWEDISLGRYTLTKLLGSGGMGRVFLARDKVLARDVALKAIPQRLGDQEQVEYLKQFMHEARVIAALEHGNVVRIYDVLTDSGVVAIAMEYIRGGDLQRVVRKHTKLDYKLAWKLILQALRGLSFAHDQGVIHRDIKPGNLMLTPDGICKLVDFGAARVVHKAELALLEGKTIGTPYYMPPEVVLGKEPTAQSDLYSMAGVLWFALTGNPPYTGKTAKHVYAQHVKAPLPNVADLGAVPGELGTLLLEALAKDPAARPSSAAEFADRLEAILQGDAPQKTARPAAPARPASPTAAAVASARPSNPEVLSKTGVTTRVLNTTSNRAAYQPKKSKLLLWIGIAVVGVAVLGLLIYGARQALDTSGTEKFLRQSSAENTSNAPATDPLLDDSDY